MDPQLIAAISGLLVLLMPPAVYFVKTAAERAVRANLIRIEDKLSLLVDSVGELRAELGISRENVRGEVGKLDIRLQLCEGLWAERMRSERRANGAL